MSDMLEISQNVWLDESDSTVVIVIDRVSITLDINEFWEFCEEIEIAKDKVVNHEKFIVGSYEEDDGTIKKELLPAPDKNDFN